MFSRVASEAQTILGEVMPFGDIGARLNFNEYTSVYEGIFPREESI